MIHLRTLLLGPALLLATASPGCSEDHPQAVVSQAETKTTGVAQEIRSAQAHPAISKTIETNSPSPPKEQLESTGRKRVAMKPVSEARADVHEEPTSDLDLTLALAPNGGVDIRLKGAPIAKPNFLFWGPKWTWANSSFRLGPMRGNRAELNGEIKNLQATIKGTVQVVDDRTLRYDLNLRTEKDFPDAVGGGFEWKLTLDSPAFGEKSRNPELLGQNEGWDWQVGPNPKQKITVRFEPPIAKVYFERNQKNAIRTFLLADGFTAGNKSIVMTVTLPEGGSIVQSPHERYGPVETSKWFENALRWDSSPVDLSYLNKDDKPAGRHGPVRADGDRLVFADGTVARFWGANLAAYALFSTPRENIPLQAHRIAQLGYNLIRIHHHDSDWVRPNVFDKGKNTLQLNPRSLDIIDLWVKALKAEGIYIWLDMHVGRALREEDPIAKGMAEIMKHRGMIQGFSYLNPDILRLMRRFQKQYVDRVNPYTKLAYKDDPAIMGLLLTNENDLTNHFGNNMLKVRGNQVHSEIFYREIAAFAEETGLPANRLEQTWLPGPSKIFLNNLEHQFNRPLIEDLRGMGFRTPIATTNFWGNNRLSSLPSLTEGDVIDVHSYGRPEALSVNPRYDANLIPWIGGGQIYGKPLTITEWNIEFPFADRFTGPLYVSALSCLQGWDAPMLFDYSDAPLVALKAPTKWTTSYDPSITGIMPAAAVAFRRGHVSPARETYCLMLDRESLFNRDLCPPSSATLRTLVERSKLTIGIPEIKELPWVEGTKLPSDVKVETSPDRDFIPQGQNFVRSDTEEITRDWKEGILTIDTPKSQSVSGWIGGKSLETMSATVRLESPKKAVVALTSIDDRPLSESEFILVTALARSQPLPDEKGALTRMPFFSEPVVATIRLKTTRKDLQLLTLGSNGRVLSRTSPTRDPEGISITIPTTKGTHWYALKGNPDSARENP